MYLTGIPGLDPEQEMDAEVRPDRRQRRKQKRQLAAKSERTYKARARVARESTRFADITRGQLGIIAGDHPAQKKRDAADWISKNFPVEDGNFADSLKMAAALVEFDAKGEIAEMLKGGAL